MANWRELCAELVRASDAVHHDAAAAEGDFLAAIDNARAALAQSKPEGVGPITDGRPMNQSYWLALLGHDAYAALFQSVDQYRSALIERASSPRAQPEPAGPSHWDVCQWLEQQGHWGDNAHRIPRIANMVQGALTRYTHPAIEPLPVAERLPGPEDCDAEGRCWFGTPSSYVMVANWVYEKAEHCRSWNTHWAPHWALPVPAPANTINQNNY